MVMRCDGTLVRVGESRGQIWVSRRQNEPYHPGCIHARYRGYTELMFWGCYTFEMRGSSYIFGRRLLVRRLPIKPT